MLQNSIRHNLSLHNRFMRIQNEGTGKSSWWVINPDAKPGKTPRRRATSMDTKTFEKKRGRVKKKVEQMRANMENATPDSTNSLNESINELLPDAFGDFRARTSSNASSIGRLSPIHSGQEPDLHDSQVPPMSPIPWNDSPYVKSEGFPETLSESLAEMLVNDMTLNTLSPDAVLSDGPLVGGVLSPGMSTASPMHSQQVSPGSTYSPDMSLRAPPPYPDSTLSSPHSPNMMSHGLMSTSLVPTLTTLTTLSPNSLSPNASNQSMDGGLARSPGPSFLSQTLEVLQQGNGGTLYQNGLLQDNIMALGTTNTTVNNVSQYSAFQNTAGMRALSQPSNNQQATMFESAQQQRVALLNSMQKSLLRQALTVKQEQQANNPVSQQLQMSRVQQLLNSNPQLHQQQLQQLQQQQQQQQQAMGHGLQMPQDIDPNLCGDIGCDVDEVINWELNYDGNLDFNFEPMQMQSGDNQQQGTIQT